MSFFFFLFILYCYSIVVVLIFHPLPTRAPTANPYTLVQVHGSLTHVL